MTLILKLLLIGGIIYVLIVTIIWFLQDRLIFLGVKIKDNYQFKFNQSFIEYNIESAKNVKINTLLFKSEKKAKGLIVYFHGNADNLKRWGKYTSSLTELSYDVLIFDYRGYGKSTGIPTEKSLYNDAEFIWKWAKNNLITAEVLKKLRTLVSLLSTI